MEEKCESKLILANAHTHTHTCNLHRDEVDHAHFPIALNLECIRILNF